MVVPPAWIHSPKDIDVLSGEHVTINCKASGRPIPSVTWARTSGIIYFTMIFYVSININL